MVATVRAPDFSADPADRADLRPRRGSGVATAATLLALAAAGTSAWMWWSAQQQPDAPPAAAPIQSQAPADAPPAAAPAAQHPVPTPAEGEALAANEVAGALQHLLGRSTLEAFVLADDFPRRLVATLDQLGREHAPPALWPVQATPARLLVEQRGDTVVIAAANAQRYVPVVTALTAVDPAAAAALYRRMYPLLDQAWRQLGMGNRSLNDRVFEVIDLLLQTPEPQQPLEVQLTEVKGPIPSMRPWVRYEFVDPELQALPAGQKILLRMGAPERQRVKVALRELRRQLAK